MVQDYTRPYRMGANVLAKGYEPVTRAIWGQDVTQTGPGEELLRKLLTEEERQNLDEDPYKQALKSSVGIGASLGGFSGYKVPMTALLNGLRNAAWAYGASDEGEELGDTVTGGLLGSLGGYIGDQAKRFVGGAMPLVRSTLNKADDFADITSAIQRNPNMTGFNRLTENVIRKYSNTSNPKTYLELIESITPEFRGEALRKLGKTAWTYGDKAFRPVQTATKDTMGNVLKLVLRALTSGVNTVQDRKGER